MDPKFNESDPVIQTSLNFTVVRTGSAYVVTRTDTNVVTAELASGEVADPETTDLPRVPLRAELREAFEDTWKRHKAAYRYLGR